MQARAETLRQRFAAAELVDLQRVLEHPEEFTGEAQLAARRELLQRGEAVPEPRPPRLSVVSPLPKALARSAAGFGIALLLPAAILGVLKLLLVLVPESYQRACAGILILAFSLASVVTPFILCLWWPLSRMPKAERLQQAIIVAMGLLLAITATAASSPVATLLVLVFERIANSAQ
jgi:hypothetical protein